MSGQEKLLAADTALRKHALASLETFSSGLNPFSLCLNEAKSLADQTSDTWVNNTLGNAGKLTEHISA